MTNFSGTPAQLLDSMREASGLIEITRESTLDMMAATPASAPHMIEDLREHAQTLRLMTEAIGRLIAQISADESKADRLYLVFDSLLDEFEEMYAVDLRAEIGLI